jgi:hypothetical protein
MIKDKAIDKAFLEVLVRAFTTDPNLAVNAIEQAAPKKLHVLNKVKQIHINSVPFVYKKIDPSYASPERNVRMKDIIVDPIE